MKHETLPSSFFAKNRKELQAKLPKNSFALLYAAEPMVRNRDFHHFWRQDSNFFYLTGIEQANCALLLFPLPEEGSEKPDAMLYIPPVDPEREKWDGKMLTTDQAIEISEIQQVLDIANLESQIFRTQTWKEALYCDVNEVFSKQPLTQQHLFLQDLSARLPGLALKKLGPLVAEGRVVKKAEEIEYMQKAIDIAGKGLLSVMKKMKPGMMEYEVEAELAYHYLANGCTRLGFDTIAAGGINATILHYIDNCEELQDEDLILIDTGGEYGMYSGDITRTIPVSGKFSNRQKHCYQAVLDIQKEIIDQIKPGIAYIDFYKTVSDIQGRILKEYGIIKDPKKHKAVTLHGTSHYLGLDVHDVGNPDWKFQPGNVITVEPGLYLVDEKIGIRIEDDVLITENGAEVLSKSIPKEIKEIESIMAK